MPVYQPKASGVAEIAGKNQLKTGLPQQLETDQRLEAPQCDSVRHKVSLLILVESCHWRLVGIVVRWPECAAATALVEAAQPGCVFGIQFDELRKCGCAGEIFWRFWGSVFFSKEKDDRWN